MDFVFRRIYRGPIRLVVFDWSGTTIDHGCMAPTAVFIDVFKRRQVEISIDEARAPMGMGKKDHIRAISKQSAVAQRWRDVHGRECTEDDVTDMYENDFRRLQLACLTEHSTLIPGTLECVRELRRRDIKIGTSTGFFREATEINLREAHRQGYDPDATFCATDVPAGRPEPWMVLANMQATRTFPPEAVVKIGDTQPDIGEGLNAGVWSVGVSRTGNEVGLPEAALNALAESERRDRVARADTTLRQCGAHDVVESIADVPLVLDRITSWLAAGGRP